MSGRKKSPELSSQRLRQMAEFRRMVETHLQRVGRAIQIRREELGWSRARLAREIPVDPKTVERWEKARTAGASAELDRIAGAMQTTSAAMLAAAVAEEKSDQSKPSGSPLDALSGSPSGEEIAQRLAVLEEAVEKMLANEIEILAGLADLRKSQAS